MERIVLEVGDETAKTWRNTSPRLRAQIGKNLEMILGDSLSSDKEAILSLKLTGITFLTRTYEFKFPILFQILFRRKGDHH